MLCSFQGCNEPAKKAGLCKAHYRQKARGVSLTPLRKPLSIEERLAASSVKQGDCLIWTGARRTGGRYGRIAIDGERFGAHRIAYECKHGYLPEHLHIHHTCGNNLCINPDHLVPLEPRDHMRLHNGTNRLQPDADE